MMRIKIASREKGREISVFDQEVGWQDVRANIGAIIGQV